MRKLNRLVTLAIAMSVFVGAFATPALASAEGQFFSKINASRAAAGKAPLEVYWDLADDARAQSAAMAIAGKISHSPGLSGVTSGWQALAENVGVGVAVDALHQGFMASPGHRANILGDYNYIGVGVKIDEAGLIWVTTIFMKADPNHNGGGETTTTTAPPPTTTTTLPPQPVIPAPPTTATVPPPVAPLAEKAAAPVPPTKARSAGSAGISSDNLIVGYGHPRGPYAI